MTADGLLQEFMLALCVYREARGESDLGKQLVAQTILNRARDAKDRWPKTIVGVVCQPLQFSSFNRSDPNVNVFPKEGEVAWIKCVWAAERVLGSNTPICLANHYHTKDVKPSWADSSKIVTSEGAHIFYNL